MIKYEEPLAIGIKITVYTKYMARNISAHEEYLLLGKMTDSLNEKEKLECEVLLQESPDAARAYEALCRQFPGEEVAETFRFLNAPGYWRDLSSELKKADRDKWLVRGSFLRRMAAAAIIVGLLVGGWWLFTPRTAGIADTESISATVSFPPQTGTGIQLKLASGELIDLSVEKGSIKAGAARLSNSGDMLTYSGSDRPDRGTNQITVPIGMDYRITLSDGTLVWLNSATRLEFPFEFAGTAREITIDGEAYLQVARNEQLPFIVHLPNSSVRVLGTTFNVNSYDQESMKVALVEGSVRVNAGERILELQPGKQAVYGTENEIQQQNFDPTMVLGWQKGLYYFNESTLADISKVVARWFGLTVVIDDPALNDKKFVGVLDRNEPIDVFLDDMKVISRIDSYLENGKVLHFR